MLTSCSGCQLAIATSEVHYRCSECATEFIYCENCFQSRRSHAHPFNRIMDSGWWIVFCWWIVLCHLPNFFHSFF